MPCTSPPGGVDDEHKYTPRKGVRYGTGPNMGRAISCQRLLAEVPQERGQFGKFSRNGALRKRIESGLGRLWQRVVEVVLQLERGSAGSPGTEAHL